MKTLSELITAEQEKARKKYPAQAVEHWTRGKRFDTEHHILRPEDFDSLIASAVTKTASAVMEECLPKETQGAIFANGDPMDEHTSDAVKIGFNACRAAFLSNVSRWTRE